MKRPKRILESTIEKNRDVILARKREQDRARYKMNPEKMRAKSRKWTQDNPEKIRQMRKNTRMKYGDKYNSNRRGRVGKEYHLRTRYGIGIAEYDVMFDKQEGRCAIEGCASQDLLAVDHCHKTGGVRGLLCRKCNAAIGALGDDYASLIRAAEYLRKYEVEGNPS